MAICARGSLVQEFCTRKPGAHILVTFQAHLFAGNTQHAGDIAAMRIMAGDTRSGGGRPMDEAALELFLFMALEAKRFRGLHKLRWSPFSRDPMAKLAQIVFCQKTIHF